MKMSSTRYKLKKGAKKEICKNEKQTRRNIHTNLKPLFKFKNRVKLKLSKGGFPCSRLKSLTTSIGRKL